jgi:hypothetical protein
MDPWTLSPGGRAPAFPELNWLVRQPTTDCPLVLRVCVRLRVLGFVRLRNRASYWATLWRSAFDSSGRISRIGMCTLSPTGFRGTAFVYRILETALTIGSKVSSRFRLRSPREGLQGWSTVPSGNELRGSAARSDGEFGNRTYGVSELHSSLGERISASSASNLKRLQSFHAADSEAAADRWLRSAVKRQSTSLYLRFV